MNNYREQLKDPRWQRKRLEVMQRDEFTCQRCNDKTSPLVVHHYRYIKGHAPWEYDNSDLVTLCENCHEQEHRPMLLKQDCSNTNAIEGESFYRYILTDNNGCIDRFLPIKLKVGTVFTHDYGIYEVTETTEKYVLCNRE